LHAAADTEQRRDVMVRRRLLREVRLPPRRFTSRRLIGGQTIGEVVIVDVADAGDRLAAETLRGGALEPDE